MRSKAESPNQPGTRRDGDWCSDLAGWQFDVSDKAVSSVKGWVGKRREMKRRHRKWRERGGSTLRVAEQRRRCGSAAPHGRSVGVAINPLCGADDDRNAALLKRIDRSADRRP